MKSVPAAAAFATMLVGLAMAPASAQDKPPAQQPPEATENAYELPLPPVRPTSVATPRKMRVSQAAPVLAAPQPEPARPATRKLSTLWLTVGYGF